MSDVVEIVEGWTDNLDWDLALNGDAVDLTGATAELLLQDHFGDPVDVTGDFVVADAAAGRVRYTPDANDMPSRRSPFTGRWKITIAGRISFYPHNCPAITIVVHPLYC